MPSTPRVRIHWPYGWLTPNSCILVILPHLHWFTGRLEVHGIGRDRRGCVRSVPVLRAPGVTELRGRALLSAFGKCHIDLVPIAWLVHCVML